MAQWVIGYVAGTYNSMTEIPLNVPGQIRRINAGFYIAAGSTEPIVLSPRVTANADNEVQIYGTRSVKIYKDADPENGLVLFLFVEIALGELGDKRTIET